MALGENTLAKLQAYFHMTIDMCTSVMFLFLYLGAGFIEIILLCCCKTQKGEEISDTGKQLKLLFGIASLVYPLLWSYGLYVNIIEPLL